jgi:uridine kinase
MDKSNEHIKKLIAGHKVHLEAAGLNDALLIKKVVQAIKEKRRKYSLIISLVGGAGSGKTIFSKRLKKALPQADSIGTDDFAVRDRKYRRPLEKKNPLRKYDIKLLNKKIRQIKNLKPGRTIKVPTYNEKTGLAIAVGEKNYKHKVRKVNYLIVEGDFDLVKNPDFRIFFHVPDKIRLKNRIFRDTGLRGFKNIKEVTKNFYWRQKCQHLPHCLPATNKANLLITVKAKLLKSGFDYKYNIYKRY